MNGRQAVAGGDNRGGVSKLCVFMALLLASACSRSERPEKPSAAVLGARHAALTTTTSIDVSGDTFLRQVLSNQNAGGDTVLSLQSLGKHRTLLFLEPAEITAAVGMGTLVAARIELSIFSTGIGWGSGRPIALHRLRQASAEYQATWACALDANINNSQADCSGSTAWNMGSTDPLVQPWQSPATATAIITGGQTGVVSFDVTSDVTAVLAGTWPGHGWLMKKVDEGQGGSIEFASRERGPAPRLILEVEGGPGAGGPPDPPVGSTVAGSRRFLGRGVVCSDVWLERCSHRSR